jgi:type VI secretion system secreted protein Hcp
MSFNAFMKYAPPIEGEAEDSDFVGWTEIFSFSFGGSNPTTVGAGGGSAAGKADLSSFNVMSKFDLTTGPLFMNMCAGKHFENIEVVLCKQTGDLAKPLQFIKMKFLECYVNSLQWSGSSGGDDTPTQSMSFTFAQVTFVYTQQAATGAEAKNSGGGWNVRTNKSAS